MHEISANSEAVLNTNRENHKRTSHYTTSHQHYLKHWVTCWDSREVSTGISHRRNRYSTKYYAIRAKRWSKNMSDQLYRGFFHVNQNCQILVTCIDFRARIWYPIDLLVIIEVYISISLFVADVSELCESQNQQPLHWVTSTISKYPNV